MPIYKIDSKKKDGLQGYRVVVNYTDTNGEYKSIERTAYGKEQAKETERQLELKAKNKIHSKLTVQQLYDEYVKAMRYELRESTLDKTKRTLNLYVLSKLKDVRIDKLSKKILQDWKLSIEDVTTIKGKRLSLEYKQKIFSVFRTLLNYAVKMDYIEKNNLSALGNFKESTKPKPKFDYYTSDEFLQYIAIARQQAELAEKETGSIHEWNYYVFFSIAFYLGPRKGEIYALKWTDMIQNIILSIERSISQKLKGADRETAPKNESSIRLLQIPLPLQKILIDHYNRYKKIPGFSDDWRICGGEMCIRDSTVDSRNKTFAGLSNLKKIKVHEFRHSHASLLANEGINIQEIARRLGHSNVEITWQRYAHLYPREEDRALSVLNKVA